MHALYADLRGTQGAPLAILSGVWCGGGTMSAAFKVSNFRAHAKESLVGFLDLTLPSGMILHDCALFKKNGKRWIGLPCKSYKKRDGSTGWSALIEFTDNAVYGRFRDAALAAFDEFQKGGA
jgi:hypothetical protein